CPATCIQDACSALGHTTNTATCAAGQCVVGYDCASNVLCNSLPPPCEGIGYVPSVVNQCWGACVPATQCAGLNSCAPCTAPLTTCVSVEIETPNPVPNNHCVSIPKGCEGTPTCACMGKSVCTPPGETCMDNSGAPGMTCTCPAC